MKIREITGALESVAPLSLQDGYDNAGLQIGLTEDVETTGALLCLDVTEEVIDEAVEKHCNLIVSHHPLLFRPCKTITGKTYVERCVMKAIKNDIAIYSAHTNLDNAKGGVNYKIAECMGLSQLEWLDEKPGMDAGSGVIGTLSEVMDKEDFIAMVKEVFQAGSLKYNSWSGEKVSKVAVCGGAGAFLMSNAVAKGADAFLTGEVGYHPFFGHEDELLLMELGHYESEQYTIELLHEILSKLCPGLPLHITETETNPINYL